VGRPQILHILTASLDHAQTVLRAALSAGFRESGAVALTGSAQQPAMPIIAVRSIGLAFESMIGFESGGKRQAVVSEEYLRLLVQIANERFTENKKRMERFHAVLQTALAAAKPGKHLDWEEAGARRERLRSEGLKRQKRHPKHSGNTGDGFVDDLPLSILEA
jgi:tRNA wybutosine-synthesizing protein 3